MKFECTTHLPIQLCNVESWLLHHDEELNRCLSFPAYELIGQLVGTVNIFEDHGSFTEAVASITVHIIIISTDSDLYFVSQENRDAVAELCEMGEPVNYYEIHSIHGHDTLLTEHKQLEQSLKKIF